MNEKGTSFYWSLAYMFFIALWINIVKCVTTLLQPKRSDLECRAGSYWKRSDSVFPHQTTGIF